MLLRGPFKECKNCQKISQGVNWVNDKGYWRGCSNCGQKEYIQLPEPNKSLLYLDQFAISKLSFIRDPKHPKHARIMKDLFWPQFSELLSRGVASQAIICPESNFHLEESAVTDNFHSFHLTAHRISGGLQFRSTYSIQRSQLLAAITNYLEPSKDSLDIEAYHEAFNQDYNVWLPDLTVLMLQHHYLKKAELYRTDRQRTGAGMQRIYDKWRRESSKDFSERVREEVQGYINAIYSQMYNTLQSGLSFGMTHPIGQFFFDLLAHAKRSGYCDDDSVNVVEQFLTVENLIKVPYVRIQSYMFAAMARKIAAGQKTFKPSIVNDVSTIATVLPYVNALMLDRECAALLSEKPLSTELEWKPKVFTEAPPKRIELLTYLEECINSIPREIMGCLTDVYGTKYY